MFQYLKILHKYDLEYDSVIVELCYQENFLHIITIKSAVQSYQLLIFLSP